MDRDNRPPKGLQQTVSFPGPRLHLYEYILGLAGKYHGDNISMAIMECIEAHSHITKTRGDWRTLNETPEWVEGLVTRLKGIQVIDGTPPSKEQVVEALDLGDGDDLFE